MNLPELHKVVLGSDTPPPFATPLQTHNPSLLSRNLDLTHPYSIQLHRAATMDNEAMLSQLTKLFEKQKELAKSAILRKGQKPSKRASRAELEHQFAPEVMYPSGMMSMVRHTVIGYAYPPCTVPLADLKPITIEELELETVHRGRVLIVRALAYPMRIQAVQNGVEDSEGVVDRLSVYNVDTKLRPDQVLPKGQILAIKEPYYKVTADGGHTIRVDHPSDLGQLRPEDELVPWQLQPKLMELGDVTPAHWKERGNVAFKAKDYRGAVELYLRGLEALRKEEQLDESLELDILRNRAQANIYLGRFEAALTDADAAIIPPQEPSCNAVGATKSNVKALYRAGIAAYHLEDYQKAEDSFESILELSPADIDAVRELQRTKMRIAERDSGDHDFEAMTEYAMTVDRRIDTASFKANVRVQKTVDKGHGLFAANAIKAGELILVEKALCVAFNDEEGGDQSVIINMNTEIMSVGTHPTRLIGVVHKLRHSPKLAEEFMRLYDDGYQPRGVNIVDGLVAVDTFQVEAALDFNGFGCPAVPTCINTDQMDQATSSTGVWLTSSFINHDCTGTAARSFIGDVMVIRATKDLKKGDEILMRYKNSDDDNDEFQKAIQQSWKFKCSCAVCSAEAKTPQAKRKRRVEFIKEARSFMEAHEVTEQSSPSSNVIAKAERLRLRIETAYDSTLFKDLPRQGLVELDLWLCTAHIFASPNKVPKAAIAVLRDLGFKVSATKKKVTFDHTYARMDMAGIHAAMYLAMSYWRQGQHALGEQLEVFAKDMYKIIHGCMRGFEEKFGKLQR